jgi:hypothetical protein
MPYVTDDDSKAVRRIAEIEQELQETIEEFERRLAAQTTPMNAEQMVEWERETKALTDRIQALTTALALQRALANPMLHEQERQLGKGSPKRMKDFGYRPVSIQFLGGLEIPLMARYWCRSQAAKEKEKRLLLRLGVVGRVRPLCARVGQRSGPTRRGVKFLRGRAGAATADGSSHVSPADYDGVVPLFPASTAAAGTGRNGYRGIVGGRSCGDFAGRRKDSNPQEKARQEDQESSIKLSLSTTLPRHSSRKSRRAGTATVRMPRGGAPF